MAGGGGCLQSTPPLPGDPQPWPHLILRGAGGEEDLTGVKKFGVRVGQRDDAAVGELLLPAFGRQCIQLRGQPPPQPPALEGGGGHLDAHLPTHPHPSTPLTSSGCSEAKESRVVSEETEREWKRRRAACGGRGRLS